MQAWAANRPNERKTRETKSNQIEWRRCKYGDHKFRDTTIETRTNDDGKEDHSCLEYKK